METRKTDYADRKKTKTFIDELKNTGVFDASDITAVKHNLKNFEKKFSRQLKYPKGKFGVDADFTIMGFAEGYYTSDATSITEIVWLDAGLVISPTVDISLTCPIYVAPPVFLEGGLKAEVEARLNLFFEDQLENFKPDGELSGTITMNLGIGAGVKHFIYASGGVQGKLMSLWKFNIGARDYYELKASGSFYGKVGVLWWDFPYETEPWYEEVWIPQEETSNLSLMSNEADIYDASNYTLKDLSYLDEDAVFFTNGVPEDISLMSNLQTEKFSKIELLKTNIYQESTPQLVSFEDGYKLAVWNDAKKSDINSLQLYYSLYDGTAWSEPVLVDDDGTADHGAYLTVIGDTAYLVWQDAEKQFKETDTMEAVAPYFDISVAEYVEGVGFTVQTIDCEGLDMMPTICGEDEMAYVVWSKNSENDWFGAEGTDSICHCELINGSLSEVVTDYEELNSIISITADYDGKLTIAYCMDEDGNLSTSEDIRVYENGLRVTDEDILETNPVYHSGKLYWNSAGSIVWKDAGIQETTLSVGNYQMVQGGEERIAVVYTSSAGLASFLNVSYFNNHSNQWCEPVALTDGTGFIGAFSASMTEDGILTVLINEQEVVGTFEDTDPYGSSSLSLVTWEPYCDLTMGEVFFARDQYVAGEAMPLSFVLTNGGSQTVDSYTVQVLDEEGNALTTIKVDESIVPGQTITAETYFYVTDDASGQTVTICVDTDDLEDVNSADNSRTVKLEFEDIAVEQLVWGVKSDGTTVLSANIVNYGYAVRENLTVEFREGAEDGTILNTVNVQRLEPLTHDVVTFDVKGEVGELYYITIKESGDIFRENDYDFVAVLPDVYEIITVDSITSSSTSVYLENDEAGTVVVAVYGENGQLLTCGVEKIEEKMGEVSVSYKPISAAGSYTVKVFVLDQNAMPVCKCVVKQLDI